MSEPACKSVYDMSSKYTETPSQSSIQHGLVVCVYCLLSILKPLHKAQYNTD